MDCRVSLNLNELVNFCTETNFANLAMFTNFNDITYFGQFGNANYHYIKDWISLNVLTKTPNITWDNNQSINLIFSR